ncbi:MAG: desulfoferrodoxin [Lachnospiraceae bacterium]|nr:desulfoferrodoxin [Lachnospiraceae bacterium]
MKNEKFYICRTCGNLVNVINASGVPMMCCGKPMEALEPNTVEASGEKHIPAVTVEESAVHVMIGSVEHPMVDVHYIEWVYLQTENGGQRIHLKPNQEPKVTFLLGNEKPVAVYAYCNLHGLWKTEL